MDNHGLHAALQRGLPVVPIFIFDSQILDELEDPLDRRVEFIHNALEELQALLVARGSTLDVRIGKPEMVWQQLAKSTAFQLSMPIAMMSPMQSNAIEQ